MKSRTLLLVLLLVALAAIAIAPVAAQDDEVVFGLVLVGPRDDRGWSQAHYEAGLYVEERVPGSRMLFFESLNPADRPETTLMEVVELMVEDGASIIFTTSDAFEEDTVGVAEAFPDVTFINVSGDDVLLGTAPPNLGNVMAQIELPRLIMGCAAALTTETGRIGYLGPLINAETRRVSSSAYLGARYCYENYRGGDPDELEFTVTWIGFWFPIPGVTLDATEETNAYYDRGVDVVLSGIDTTEMLTVASQRQQAGDNVYAMPYNFRAGCDEAPDSCLGVPYYNWGVSYVQTIEDVMADEWEQSWDWIAPDFNDMNDPETSITGFAVGDAMSEENLELLNQFIDELVAFSTDPENEERFFLWEGPLNLQDGTELAAEGEFVSMEDVWYLPQLLEGMIGASE
jgi:simple sugar transport system substrate-binding protein